MSRSRKDLATKRRRRKRQEAWDRRHPFARIKYWPEQQFVREFYTRGLGKPRLTVLRKRDAEGNVQAVAWGANVTPETMERDIATMGEYARQSGLLSGAPDDVVYMSRKDES